MFLSFPSEMFPHPCERLSAWQQGALCKWHCAAHLVVFTGYCVVFVFCARTGGCACVPGWQAVRSDVSPVRLCDGGELPAAVNTGYFQAVLKTLRSDTSPVMCDTRREASPGDSGELLVSSAFQPPAMHSATTGSAIWITVILPVGRQETHE